MFSQIRQFFKLQSDEFGLVSLIGFLLFSNSVAQQISQISAVSNFLSTGGVNQILIVWIIDSIVILVMMGIQSLVIDRFNRISLISWVFFIFALSFVILRLLFTMHAPLWFNYGLLYLISEQQLLLMPMIIWILASEIFSMAQAKRLFPIIASGEFIGRLVGIGISALTPSIIRLIPDLRNEDFLNFNTLIYLIAYLLVMTGLRNVKLRQTAQTKETMKESLTEGWGFIRDVPVFRYLALVILLVLVTDTIVEFRFLVVTDSMYLDNPSQYQVFYSFYRLGITILALLLQTFLTGRIITNIKLKYLFFLEPFGSLISSIWILFPATLINTLGSMVFLKIPQTTIGKSTRKTFQSLVPEERRGRVGIFMDSYLFSAGTLLGCGISGIVIIIGNFIGSSTYHVYYLAFALLSSLFAVFSAYRLMSTYDSSMLNWRLKRRERGKSVLDKLDF